MNLIWAKLIPWIPALAAVLCGLCCLKRSWRKLAAPICITSIGLSFVLSVLVAPNVKPFHVNETDGQHMVKFFEWIEVGNFKANFYYFVDPLTIVMLFLVTGIGVLVAIYAAGYMKGDSGYARFFSSVSLFIFAMTTLVMADNLVLLYLGWEGVGLCSYLLIGFYYQKPAAISAAKKAFIVNRIGDLGFAIGIWLTYTTFETVSLSEVLREAQHGGPENAKAALTWIPYLLMLGAFGKSAQLPLHVWLPDAMEGPTPVSALIHAATMVTAGVYMIARLLPVFELSRYALPTVAIIGGATAFFAATIALCQYDIKRIWAYSTISQLGYMFLGVGVLSTFGGIFHLFTHAFFKALLFLTAGSVMHALVGQLDLRKMSGLWRKMPTTAVLMLIGCLALAGFPLTAGFFSKDTILVSVLDKGLNEHALLYTMLAIIGLVTALLTAFYTFRVWFRIFAGPLKYEMGNDLPHNENAANGKAGEIHIVHHHEPHEMPWLMNGPLVVLAMGALLAGWLCHGWVENMIETSSAAVGDHGTGQSGMNLHAMMLLASGTIAIAGIGAAAYYHLFNRAAADLLANRFSRVVRVLANKYYVDEFYDAVIVKPLHLISELCYTFDRLVIEAMVSAVGFVPRMLGITARRTQTGSLQGYGLGMAVSAAVILLVVLAFK